MFGVKTYSWATYSSSMTSADGRGTPSSKARIHAVFYRSWNRPENRQEIDKSADSPIHCPAKLLLELVELMGIEPMTS